MFTGIIEEVGRLERLDRRSTGGALTVGAQVVLENTKLGDSIAVNGVCLTVTALTARSFTVDVSEETLRVSNLAERKTGDDVNLERALAVGARLGGHIVQGHVDAVGHFLARRPLGNAVTMRFGFPPDIGRYLVRKGSIAVDGVSLTVATLGEDWFEVAVIPATLNWTTLPKLKPGAAVNLEADVLAKYVERLLQAPSPSAATPPLTAERLRALGY
ncbi:MAG: riboflavin synthase [Chloracidobacterium sp.]|uniref:Riboflavin synthase n=1 Tax=Chloracidobacterium validum TaxID=2821543 RepID=A0ABX8B6P0_9BACT|nr:riboflavin synthase [Chloracidobacterium validum]QUW02632.1 riboflavin synthase [Chloracidobacterium validum]